MMIISNPEIRYFECMLGYTETKVYVIKTKVPIVKVCHGIRGKPQSNLEADRVTAIYR
jgi:hypothetical protein